MPADTRWLDYLFSARHRDFSLRALARGLLGGGFPIPRPPGSDARRPWSTCFRCKGPLLLALELCACAACARRVRCHHRAASLAAARCCGQRPCSWARGLARPAGTLPCACPCTRRRFAAFRAGPATRSRGVLNLLYCSATPRRRGDNVRSLIAPPPLFFFPRASRRAFPRRRLSTHTHTHTLFVLKFGLHGQRGEGANGLRVAPTPSAPRVSRRRMTQTAE